MTSSLSRRTVLAGTSWAVPAIAIAAAAPALAVSQSSPSCGATRATALRRYEGQSLNLTLSSPVKVPVAKEKNASIFMPATTTMSVPLTLTIANTGTVPLPAGTKVVFSVWTLDSSGILNKKPTTLVATAGKTPNSRNESVDSLISPTLSSPQSSLETACTLDPGQEITIDLTWQRSRRSDNLANLQFLARIVTDSSLASYTEFQSDEVIGGTNH
ncbi:hypothetical protein [Actinomyces faecalis]|uniref:hypothetical protein n=1 Tax=Actinomyces faecalis TaxID=2722820 RepID=UPI001552AE4E|nr:hypothetical protein [Actinomyces faecalis]